MENQDPDVGAEPVLFVLKRANEESRSVRAKADEEKEIVRRRFPRTLLTQKTEVILVKLNGLRSRVFRPFRKLSNALLRPQTKNLLIAFNRSKTTDRNCNAARTFYDATPRVFLRVHKGVYARA